MGIIRDIYYKFLILPYKFLNALSTQISSTTENKVFFITISVLKKEWIMNKVEALEQNILSITFLWLAAKTKQFFKKLDFNK